MSLYRLQVRSGKRVLATWDRFADSPHAAACSALGAALDEWPEQRGTITISEPELLSPPAELVRDIVAERPLPGFDGRCGYCGRRCHGTACADHRDLPQLENDFSPLDEQSPPRLLAETSATGSERRRV